MLKVLKPFPSASEVILDRRRRISYIVIGLAASESTRTPADGGNDSEPCRKEPP